MSVERVRTALRKRASEERLDAWISLVLGSYLSLAVLAGVFGVGMFVVGELWPRAPAWPISLGLAAVGAAVIGADAIFHTTPYWPERRLYISHHGYSRDPWGGHGALMRERTDGTEAGRGIRVWAAVLVAGPRNIRKGIEELRAACTKTRPRIAEHTAEFLVWLQKASPVGDEALKTALRDKPELAAGMALAWELAWVSVRRQEEVKLLGFSRTGERLVTGTGET